MDERIRKTPPPIAPAAVRVTRRTIEDLARSAVPTLGDFSVVFVVTGRSLVGVASAHISPEGSRMLRALRRVYRIRIADLHSTVAQVIRTCRPAIRSGITHDLQRAVRRGSVADLHRRLGARSALVIPITDAGGVFGALTLCYAGSGREYSRANIPAARRIARALAQTLASSFPHGPSRLCPAAGDARSRPAGRKRVDPRD
jgi:GAF domain-containing protein